MIMINQKKVYIGAIATELDAAKYYDSIAIICQGLNAKTNFKYDGIKIRHILQDFDVYSEGGAPPMNAKKLKMIDSEEEYDDEDLQQ